MSRLLNDRRDENNVSTCALGNLDKRLPQHSAEQGKSNHKKYIRSTHEMEGKKWNWNKANTFFNVNAKMFIIRLRSIHVNQNPTAFPQGCKNSFTIGIQIRISTPDGIWFSSLIKIFVVFYTHSVSIHFTAFITFPHSFGLISSSFVFNIENWAEQMKIGGNRMWKKYLYSLCRIVISIVYCLRLHRCKLSARRNHTIAATVKIIHSFLSLFLFSKKYLLFKFFYKI